MKNILIASVFILSLFSYYQKDVNAGSTLQPAVDSTNVLDEVNRVNSDAAFATPSEFREGHVSNANFNQTVTQTDYGYMIKLPAGNNVPTATWQDGKVYVSGGFGSKQFFSFDAASGETHWAIDLDDDGPSSAIIEDGIAVFNTESCTIFAVDGKTGKQLWSYWLGDPLMSAPASANGMVFTTYPSYMGNTSIEMNEESKNIKENESKLGYKYSHVLIAFDLHSGNILWQKRINGDALSSPVARGNELHVVTLSGAYYVLDQRTGDFISAKECRATSAPVFIQDVVYFSQRADRLEEEVSEQFSSFDLATGILKETSEKRPAPYLDKEVQSKSALKGAAMHDDAGNGFGDGAPVTSGWQKANENIGYSNVSTLQSFYGSRILNYNGKNYSTMGGELICLLPESGEEIWKKEFSGDLENSGGYLATAPIIAGKHIVVATLDNKVLLLNPETGKEEKAFEINEPVRSQPIVMNGWIFISTTNGKLIAVNTGDTTITGWPTLGANNERTNDPL